MQRCQRLPHQQRLRLYPMQLAYHSFYNSLKQTVLACISLTLCLCVYAAALSTVSPLRALVSVSNTTMLASGIARPVLQGQTQASAMSNGTINIADLSLLAVPGIYNVSVLLPDYPQVGLSVQSAQCLCLDLVITYRVCVVSSCPA